jgi:hypothetical protein
MQENEHHRRPPGGPRQNNAGQCVRQKSVQAGCNRHDKTGKSVVLGLCRGIQRGTDITLFRAYLVLIVRSVLLEARRTRLTWFAAITIAALFTLGIFFRTLALTDSQRVLTAWLAATLRPAGALLLASFVIASIHRDYSDKNFDWILATGIPRGVLLLGKLLGYAATGLLLATVVTLIIVALGTDAYSAMAWGLSLAAELILVSAFALFAALMLPHLPGALAAVGGFYLLARSITSLQLIGHSPVFAQDHLGHRLANAILEGLRLLLPDLERFAQTAWLLGKPPSLGEWTAGLIQGLLYVTLLTAAAAIDFRRKDL